MRNFSFRLSPALLAAAALICPGAMRVPGQSAAGASKPESGTTQQSQAKSPVPLAPGLYATIETSMGNIVCRLFEKEAPRTVSNFVGLATGRKAWTDPETGKVQHRPLYPGTVFHRVIPGFMIQGGDPLADGSGTPGYRIDDEISPQLSFDKPGVLAMANSGPNTNGSQFFITVAPAPHLNGRYSIFGEVVEGQQVADTISTAPRNDEDKPLKPVKILRIAIRRVHAVPSSSESTK